MKFRSRQLVEGKPFEDFCKGFTGKLPGGEVVRLSIKMVQRQPTFVALVAKKEFSSPGKLFELPCEEGVFFLTLGERLAELAEDFFEKDGFKRDPHFYDFPRAHNVTMAEELIRDQVELWVSTYRLELGGKLHPVAHKALISSLLVTVQEIQEYHAAEMEKLAPFPVTGQDKTQPTPNPPKRKARGNEQ